MLNTRHRAVIEMNDMLLRRSDGHAWTHHTRPVANRDDRADPQNNQLILFYFSLLLLKNKFHAAKERTLAEIMVTQFKTPSLRSPGGRYWLWACNTHRSITLRKHRKLLEQRKTGMSINSMSSSLQSSDKQLLKTMLLLLRLLLQTSARTE